MEDRATILAKVSEVAAGVLDHPGLALEEGTSARDVAGWDSLSHVQIVIGVERAFGIRMTATEVAQLTNAGSLVDAVLAHRS